jgi:hypothetical protein
MQWGWVRTWVAVGEWSNLRHVVIRRPVDAVDVPRLAEELYEASDRGHRWLGAFWRETIIFILRSSFPETSPTWQRRCTVQVHCTGALYSVWEDV